MIRLKNSEFSVLKIVRFIIVHSNKTINKNVRHIFHFSDKNFMNAISAIKMFVCFFNKEY